MNFNKYKGFTVAELMIMLSVLTVLLAAFAPVFTVRYKSASTENVWSYVNNSDEMDAYTDPLSKVLAAQSFIGISPGDKNDVFNSVKNNSSDILYSKLVIRASDRLSVGEKQKQMLFRYGTSKEGKVVGALFAGKSNILLGGTYKNIDTGYNNTAYGSESLNAITSGYKNTALGYVSSIRVTTGHDNTTIGYKAGAALTSGHSNTFVGYEAGSKISTGQYNTAMGNYSGPSSTTAKYSTIIGDYSAQNLSSGDGNTVVGYSALPYDAGAYNTVIGSYAMHPTSSRKIGDYNTAVGYNACSGLTSGASKHTCIGYNSGTSVAGSGNDFLLGGNYERIFIGTKPVTSDSSVGDRQYGGASVLEVHNLSSTNRSARPFGGRGDSSVVINGNLIVRGQPFFNGQSPLWGNTPALIGFSTERPKDATHTHCFKGWDGNRKEIGVPGRRGRIHKRKGGNTNCVCARKCSADTDGLYSYDWTTMMTNRDREVDGYLWMGSYRDASLNKTCNPKDTDHDSMDLDLNFAHGRSDGNSCCPNLRSDIRLKNLFSPFSAGLAEINRINVYNYTYKSDENKISHVGVIAQDLKRVFPTAVTKDENGYYQIRWDEMLYAAINAIKTINNKVESLAARVSKDQARIAALKKDNETLEQKVDVLTNELTLIEKKLK